MPVSFVFEFACFPLILVYYDAVGCVSEYEEQIFHQLTIDCKINFFSYTCIQAYNMVCLSLDHDVPPPSDDSIRG